MSNRRMSIETTVASAMSEKTAEKEIAVAWELLNALMDFAYEQGFHECGYNPAKFIADSLSARIADLESQNTALENHVALLIRTTPEPPERYSCHIVGCSGEHHSKRQFCHEPRDIRWRLPVITQEMVEDWIQEQPPLIELDADGKYQWTQDAVDIACMFKGSYSVPYDDGRSPPETADAHCLWVYDSDGFWSTACGTHFAFSDGDSPVENDFHFCHKCGQPLSTDKGAATP